MPALGELPCDRSDDGRLPRAALAEEGDSQAEAILAQLESSCAASAETLSTILD